ncbi:MAG: hypothetical protein ACXWQ5_01045 [Ktedonobacterales bacterium]
MYKLILTADVPTTVNAILAECTERLELPRFNGTGGGIRDALQKIIAAFSTVMTREQFEHALRVVDTYSQTMRHLYYLASDPQSTMPHKPVWYNDAANTAQAFLQAYR